MTHIDTDAGAHMNFERLLQFMDSLIIDAEGPKREEARNLARHMVQVLGSHHLTTGGYLGLVLIFYAAGTFLIKGGPDAADGFLSQIVGWLNDKIDGLYTDLTDHSTH